MTNDSGVLAILPFLKVRTIGRPRVRHQVSREQLKFAKCTYVLKSSLNLEFLINLIAPNLA